MSARWWAGLKPRSYGIDRLCFDRKGRLILGWG